MMPHVISSNSTLVYKSVVPLLLVAFSGLFAVSMFASPGGSTFDGLVATLPLIGVTVFFCWYGTKLKQVRIDEHNLYVAGIFKEISIPLTAIESVGGISNGSTVTLRLKEKSEFGRKIYFVAKWTPVLPWEAHPIFTQLGQLIRKKQIS